MLSDNRMSDSEIAKLHEYVQEGVDQGTSCARIDECFARNYAQRLMRHMGRPCRNTLIVDSPIAAELLIIRYRKKIEEYFRSAAECNANRDNLNISGYVSAKYKIQEHHDKIKCWGVLSNLYRDSVSKALNSAFDANYPPDYINIIRGIYARECDIQNRYNSEITNQIQKIFEAKEYGFPVYAFLAGSFSAVSFAICRFYRDILNVYIPNLWIFSQQTEFGMVYPLADAVIITQKPSMIDIEYSNNSKVTIRYADGFECSFFYAWKKCE